MFSFIVLATLIVLFVAMGVGLLLAARADACHLARLLWRTLCVVSFVAFVWQTANRTGDYLMPYLSFFAVPALILFLFASVVVMCFGSVLVWNGGRAPRP
jgi:hypothetical protein